jgi:hypothetical protein
MVPLTVRVSIFFGMVRGAYPVQSWLRFCKGLWPFVP